MIEEKNQTETREWEEGAESNNDTTTEKKYTQKRVKDLYALSILLGGLLVGSLFVDIVQLVSKKGISPRALATSDIFQMDGKTWVAYNEPPVRVTVVNDPECQNCQVENALVPLRRFVPTMQTNEINVNSSQGKRLMEITGSKTLPVFIFDPTVEGTNFYSQAKDIFEKKDVLFVLNTGRMGIAPGKYIKTPTISDKDAQKGDKNAKANMIVFSDLQCPYCKLLHPSMMKAMQEYGDKIHVVFKHFPLDAIHPQANNAALASACAQEQDKFFEYATMLFDNQLDWGKTQGTAKFKQYAAQMRLKTSQFNECLDSKKYQEQIDADRKEGEAFGISGTPGTFVNDQFLNGAVQYNDLKKLIDEQINKKS